MELHALGVHHRAAQWHPVLPAVEATDTPPGEVVGGQAVTVAVRPYEPFPEGRLELAVDADDSPVRVDANERAVDRAA